MARQQSYLVLGIDHLRLGLRIPLVTVPEHYAHDGGVAVLSRKVQREHTSLHTGPERTAGFMHGHEDCGRTQPLSSINVIFVCHLRMDSRDIPPQLLSPR